MPCSLSIWIVTLPNYPHSQAFEPIAVGLQAGLRALGYDAPIVTSATDIKDYAIVLGTNLLQLLTHPLPERLILYNLEQIEEGSPWMSAGYIDLLKRYPVWDYSALNIAALTRYGIKAALCGIGYMPALTRIPVLNEDIDVVFIGSLNTRRLHVLQQLGSAGKNVVVGTNSYGADRDRLMARGKIMINLHYYEAKVFEIARVSYLLANKRCVVSEVGNDAAMEAPLKEGVAFVPYEALADTCLRLLQDEAQRLHLAQKGFELFTQFSQVPMLERALAVTPWPL